MAIRFRRGSTLKMSEANKQDVPSFWRCYQEKNDAIMRSTRHSNDFFIRKATQDIFIFTMNPNRRIKNTFIDTNRGGKKVVE